MRPTRRALGQENDQDASLTKSEGKPNLWAYVRDLISFSGSVGDMVYKLVTGFNIGDSYEESGVTSKPSGEISQRLCFG